MKDVAMLAGVGLKTVSRVVNEEGGVSPQIVEKVTSAIASLRYSPDQRAGSLRRGDKKTGTIGLVVSSVANPFAAAVHKAVEDAAARRGTAVLAASLDDDPLRERRIVDALLGRRVDGLILTTVARSQAYLLTEQEFGTPLVFIDRAPIGIDGDTVLSNNSEGAEKATNHLLKQGHKRIAYLGDRLDIRSAQARHQGYLRAIGRAGIATSAVQIIDDLHSEEAACQASLRLFTSPDAPTAVFSSQNLVTIGVIRALRQLNLHRTIAVVGFDDFPLADLLEPAVTVVAQRPETIGAVAAECLFRRLVGAEAKNEIHMIDTDLIVRGSGEIPPS